MTNECQCCVLAINTTNNHQSSQYAEEILFKVFNAEYGSHARKYMEGRKMDHWPNIKINSKKREELTQFMCKNADTRYYIVLSSSRLLKTPSIVDSSCNAGNGATNDPAIIQCCWKYAEQPTSFKHFQDFFSHLHYRQQKHRTGYNICIQSWYYFCWGEIFQYHTEILLARTETSQNQDHRIRPH